MTPPWTERVISGDTGETLWCRAYSFRRAHGAGETFIENGITYKVLSCIIDRENQYLTVTVQLVSAKA